MYTRFIFSRINNKKIYTELKNVTLQFIGSEISKLKVLFNVNICNGGKKCYNLKIIRSEKTSTPKNIDQDSFGKKVQVFRLWSSCSHRP